MSVTSTLLYKSILFFAFFVDVKFKYDTNKAKDSNTKVLFNILSENKNTEIGKDYNFKNINTIDEFKKNIPITNYSFYEKYIDKMLKGSKGILFKGKVKYFAHTSGTTGKQKLIPANNRAMKTAAKYMALLMNRYCYKDFKDEYNFERGVLLADFIETSYTDDNIPICSATSGGMAMMKKIVPLLYTSPIEVMSVEDKEVSFYLHMLFALKYKSLMFISGVFISNVLDFFRILDKYSDELIKDIKKGSISHKIKLDDSIRCKLNKMLKPDASRASELKKEFDKGYDNIAKRIWPKLTYIATVTGANFSIYDDKVKKYLGRVPIYSTVYAATEGTIGINPDSSKIRYIIIPDTVFYEFRDINNPDENKTYLINEVQIGKKYEIILTTYAGLYRYTLGDVVKVIDFYNSSPIIEFCYRKNQALNMVSEKTNEEHIIKAIEHLCKKYDIEITDFTSIAYNSISPGRYNFYIEMKNKKNYIKNLDEKFDNELRKTNVAYDRARNLNKLQCLKIIFLKENSFSDMKELLYKKGVSKNQIKIPRVITKKELISFLNRKAIKD